MKKVVLLVSLLPVVLAAAMLPKNVIAELATGTWCGWCPDAYEGLEVMKAKYPISDFVCIRYYNRSGDLSNAEADARDDYYGISGYPTCVFNGTEKVIGGGDFVAEGLAYDPVISSILLEETTPFWIEVELDVGSGQATATATIKLYEDYSGTAPKLWIALTEDEIDDEITNATRRIVDAGQVTITNEGQEHVAEETFDIEAGWTAGKLHAVAFLQIHSTKEILQIGSSYPQPDYHFRVSALSDAYSIERVDPSGSFTASFYLANVGTQPDEYNFALDKSGLPSGWSADIIMPLMQTIDPSEGTEFIVEIRPHGNTGQGDVILQVSSTQGGEAWELPIRAITNDVDYNLVDDDGGEEFEDYFTAALDAIGATYGVWGVDMADFHLNNLADDMSPVLIWSCGWAFPSLDQDQRDLLRFYLDAGGKLFLTGQDIGWDLNDANSDNATYDAKQFYSNYLHARYVADSAASLEISGIEGDPITDGMSFDIEGGDGADNQVYPSIIRPYDEYATSILTYSTGDTAAIRAEKDLYKVVYLAFGYEAIDNPTDRKDLLENALDWLGPAPPITGLAEKPIQAASVLLDVNGISKGTLVAFYSVPCSGGQIDVYDALGRRVAGTRLSEREGRIELNVEHLPAGCYFVCLKTEKATSSRKVVLIR